MPPDSADLEPGVAARERVAQIHAVIERDAEELGRAIAMKIQKLGGPRHRDQIAELAFEVLDETVRRALARPGSYDPARSAFGWLMGIALKVLANHGRIQARQRRQVPGTDLGDDTWEQILTGLTCEASDRAVADRIDLHQALGRLDPPTRNVLECRFLRGLEGEELAEALGAVSPGAARVRVCRALQRLRAEFDPESAEVTP